MYCRGVGESGEGCMVDQGSYLWSGRAVAIVPKSYNSKMGANTFTMGPCTRDNGCQHLYYVSLVHGVQIHGSGPKWHSTVLKFWENPS